MSQPIKIVAQSAMDTFYQDYKSDGEFFDIDDFIFQCGSTLADFYQKEYQAKYAEMKGEKKDDVVAFDSSVLLEQLVDVKNEKGVLSCTLVNVMSLAYDKCNSGIQLVFRSKPGPEEEIERSSVHETWSYKLLPATNRIFFREDGDRLKFFKKGNSSVSEVRILYVPAIGAGMEVPDGIVKYCIDQTVATMKGLASGTVVKKSIDQNDNKTLQTEVDKASVT